MAELAVERTLYQAPRFRLAEFWCPPDSARWRVPNVIPDRPHVAFPRTSTVIGHAGREASLANANHVVFYNPGQRYRRVLHDPDGDRCWFLELDTALMAELVDGGEFCYATAPGDASVRLLLNVATRHATEDRADPLLLEETVMTVLERAVAAASRFHRLHQRSVSSSHRDLVERAKSVLTDTACEQLPLSELGQRLGTSEFHLARVFRSSTGLSLHAYRNQLRLRLALDRLGPPDVNLADLAHELGFASHSHLTDSFRRTFGIPPSVVRGGIETGTMRRIRRIAETAELRYPARSSNRGRRH